MKKAVVVLMMVLLVGAALSFSAYASDDAEVVKQALTSMGDAVTRRQLVKLLGHQAWDVRLAAVERLAPDTGEDEVGAALEARLEGERDDLVAGAIERALDRGRRQG